LVLHGFGEHREGVSTRALALARSGWTVLLPDARGHGQSDGDHTSFGAREAGDVCAWLDDLSTRLGTACTWVVWGRSMGAAVALRAAADPRIRALVLEAPYPDLQSAVAAGLRRYHIPRQFASLILARAASLAGVSLDRPSPISLARTVRLPVLILHGSNDPVVPPGEVRRLAEAFPTTAVVIEVPGAGHANLFGVGGEELMGRVIEFLNQLPQPG
jgi:alpha-beta hydrolase superfamily lysophospholipase